MTGFEQVLRDLVIANRVLANEDVVDAYGHISVRHPDDPGRFFLSRSRSPELVEQADLMEFTLDGKAVGGDAREPYLERFIHAAIYEARPEVHSVLHSHAEDVLPYSIAEDAPIKPVIHSASIIGQDVPVWDIADKFGDTDLLVRNIAQGRNLAQRLGAARVVLMRGHGFAAAGVSIADAVRLGVYLPRNARVQTAARSLGRYKVMSKGEIDTRVVSLNPNSLPIWRAWEYWATRAGCAHLLGAPPER